MDFILNGIIKAGSLLITGNPEAYSAIFTTLKVSTLSILFSLIIGLPAGFFLGYLDFPMKRQVRAFADTLLALPTVVVGLLVYSLVSKQGPLGEFNLLFTISGIVIAQTILILPIVVSLTANAVESLDSRLIPTLRTLGAGQRNIIISSLYEARYSVLTAAVTAYGRAISEVGVSMIVGGNIKWHTRTITTSMALESGKGDFAMGIALGLVLLAIAFAVNSTLVILKRRSNEK